MNNSSSNNPLHISLLLFVSGFCGISYEILYGRLLGNIIGDQFAVSSAVLLTFMLGIGVGALHAHRLWRHLWLIEAGIGVYALLFTLNLDFIETFLYQYIPSVGTSVMVSLVVAVLLLATPAFMIGVSVPLFAGYLNRLQTRKDYFAKTYAIYNFGAAVTVIFIEFFLIRMVGIKYAVHFIALLNALVALKLFFHFKNLAGQSSGTAVVTPVGFPRRVLFALAISAVGSAIFQLTAVRFGELMFGPYRETFAYVLAIVLLGIALGSVLVSRYRIRFEWLMLGGMLSLCWTMSGLILTVEVYAKIYWMINDSYWLLVLWRFLCFATLMLGPAVCFGATIPALLLSMDSSAQENGMRASVRSPGYLLYIASMANAFGFLLMFWVLHQRLDYGDLLLIVVGLAGLSVVIMGLGKKNIEKTGMVKLRGWGLLALVGSLCLFAVIARFFWNETLLYHGHQWIVSKHSTRLKKEPFLEVERYKGKTDVLSINRYKGEPYFFINGKISYRMDSPAEKMVGAIGAVFSPDNRKAMVLGIGSGATAGTIGLLFDEVHAVEISDVILQNLHRLESYNFGITEMPNVKLIHDDALHAVKVAEGDYSLILNTVTSPLFFNSAKLYTEEFIQQVQRLLRPGGLYITWLDSRVGDIGADIMLGTVSGVFNHCGLAQVRRTYFLMLCSDEPIVVHQPDIVSQQPQLVSYFYDQNAIDPANIHYSLLSTNVRSLLSPSGYSVNLLDKPVLSFEMSRSLASGIPNLANRIIKNLNLAELNFAYQKLDWSLFEMINTQRKSSNKYDPYLEQWDFLYREERNKIHAKIRVAMKAGQCKEMPGLLKAFWALNGRSNNPDIALGNCYESNGEPSLALAAYKRVRALHPKNTQLGLLFGRVMLTLQNYESALVELDAVAEKYQGIPYHYMKGIVLDKLNRKEAAKRHLDMAQSMAGSMEKAKNVIWNIAVTVDAL